jgi:hypothetical protein
MLNVILRIVGFLFLIAGVIMVYDARILTRNWFGFGDQNEASLGFKILGFILCIIGGIVVYFNVRG